MHIKPSQLSQTPARILSIDLEKFCIVFPGLRTIRYGTVAGSVEIGLAWTGQQGWCSAQNGETLRVGDVNGDGLYDLLCHDAAGKTTVMFNQGGGGFVNFHLLVKEKFNHKVQYFVGYYLQSLKEHFACK